MTGIVNVNSLAPSVASFSVEAVAASPASAVAASVFCYLLARHHR